MTLFRQEVINHRNSRWTGKTVPPEPRTSSVIAVASIGFVLAAASLFFFGHYTQYVRLDGQLVPDSGLLTVMAPTNGTVSRILTVEGAAVRQGSSLVELSTELTSHAGDTHALVAAQFDAERSSIEKQIVSQRAASKQELESIRRKVAMLNSELLQIDSQIELNQQQVKSYETLLAAIQPLRSKGLISEFEVQERQTTAIGARTSLAGLKREKLRAEQQVETLQEQLSQVPFALTSRENELERKLAELGRDSAQNESQRLVELSAPTDGTVSYLAVRPGQTVAAGTRLLSIVPQASKLQAEILVPSSSIGLIRAGQAAVIRYAAFPFERYGSYHGRVSFVSAVAAREEPAMGTSKAFVGPMYRVEVDLERQTIDAQERAVALRPGMALSIDILLERRKLMDWIVEPLTRVAKAARGGIE